MWINLVLTLYAVHIFVQKCCGIHFIELPGFQSDNDAKDPPTTRDLDIETENQNEASNDFNSKVGHKEHDGRNEWMTNEQPYPKVRSQTDARHHKERHDNEKHDKHEHKKHKNERHDSEGQEDESHNTRVTSDQVRRYWLVTKTGTKGTHLPSTDPCDKDAKLKEKISRLVEQTVHDTEQKMRSVQKLKDQHRDENPYKIGFILSMVKKSNDMLNELFNLAVKHRHEWRALEQMKTFESIVHTNVDTTHLVRQLVEIHIQHLNSTKNDNNKDAGKRRVVLL